MGGRARACEPLRDFAWEQLHTGEGCRPSAPGIRVLAPRIRTCFTIQSPRLFVPPPPQAIGATCLSCGGTSTPWPAASR